MNCVDDLNKINNLKKVIEKKIEDNSKLKFQEKNMKQQSLRYKEIFNKSYLSIWEENPIDVYKILDTIPCKTGKELSEYLNTHTEILIQMITKLKIEAINSYTVLLFGASSKTEFLKKLKNREILTPEAFPGFIEIFGAMKDDKSYCKTGISTLKIDGSKLKLLVNVFIPGKGNGNLLISMMDITKRKDKEDSLSNSILLASEQRKRSEIIQRILLTLTSSLDKEKVLNYILLEVKKIVPYSTANIRLLENEKLTVAASVGYEIYKASEFIKNSSIDIKDLGDAEGYLKSGRISIITDTNKNPNWTIFPETKFIRGYIGIPFKWKNEISGILSLNSDRTGTFTESDIEKLKPFAHAVTVALDNSYLFETKNKELEKRKKIEVSIKKSLMEKEILLREIHHRVKNNLALAMSLINLQSDKVSSVTNPVVFENLKQRVNTISLVHELLYTSKNLSSVNLETYLIDLTGSIKGTSYYNSNIQFQILIRNSIELTADILVPLALILNELLMNSVKHAFSDKSGVITITVSSEKNINTIIIKDNGIGFPEQKKTSTSFLGLDLVESMTAQLKGTVNFTNEYGAVSTIIFPGRIYEQK